MIAFRYIVYHYLKYFIIILTSLVLFVVGFDYMDHAQKLSGSANLTLIYLVYKSFYAIDMLLPLSLVFAMISTKVYLINSNALVSFYSLGYSRNDILKPFVVVSILIIMLFISFHSFSSFARASEFASNIRKHSQYLSPTKDLFFTYKDKYIYFGKMLPLQAKAQEIRIFDIKKNSVTEVLVASSASYKDGYWVISKADIIKKPKNINFDSSGIVVNELNEVKTLKGFRPKMLDQVYDGKVNFTIFNAIDAILLLEKQNVDTSNIRAALYKIFIYPFFVPFLIIIIFFFVPISSRSLNISLFSFQAIFTTLLIWGTLFMLIELSNHKTISSEIGVIVPIVILCLIAIYQWKRFK
ncbi:Permease YjgP/YjgQ [hydrothermal vent metagenome]|uniref:Permease YjgP/YjgQ n=1 Tax=hydrothermal vent metagenome TaxID=652676 RepID=A0A1W1D2R4_9ZZZZ